MCVAPLAAGSIVLAQELAGFRIDPMHPLTSRAEDSLKSVILVAVVFSESLRTKAGARAAKNESGHSAAFYFSGLKT